MPRASPIIPKRLEKTELVMIMLNSGCDWLIFMACQFVYRYFMPKG